MVRSKQLQTLFHSAGVPPRSLRITRVAQVFTKGNHHPLLCEMQDDAGPAGAWVVKPQLLMSASDERREYLVLSELAAAEVCAWAGVVTPAVGLTRFPAFSEKAVRASIAALDDPVLAREILDVYRLNAGKLAFCSRHIGGAVDVLPETFRARWALKELRRSGPALFVVDHFIRNDDRQEENPNLLWYNGELVAIDHGHAFARIHAAGTTGAALARRTVIHSGPGFRDHILRKPLRKLNAPPLLRSAARTLLEVPDSDIDRLSGAWPEELDGARIDGRPAELPRARLIAYLRARREHIVEAARLLEPLVS